MVEIIWSPEALARLDQITRYIADDRSVAAARWAAWLVAAGNGLTDFPSHGRPAYGGAREVVAMAPYLLVHRIVDQVVTIERIRHSAQMERETEL